MRYSNEDVEWSLSRLCEILDVIPDDNLQTEYEHGLHPTLINNERITKLDMSIRPIKRYLIGAQSFLNQPCHFYDIFAACRHVTFIQVIQKSIDLLLEYKINNLENRLQRLVESDDYETFEATFFELVTAANYLQLNEVESLEFIDENTHEKTPDIFFKLFGEIPTYCECKKLIKSDDHSVSIRNSVKDKLNNIIEYYRNEGLSCSGEVSFCCHPHNISDQRLLNAANDSMESGSPVIESEFIASFRRLQPYKSNTYKLYPSPDFNWTRYGYRTRNKWFGLVNQIYGNYVNLEYTENVEQYGRSTWLHELSWDAGIKWEILNLDMLKKYRRFSFNRIFKALDQINFKGLNSVVHIWLESNFYLGNRQNAMLDLFNRLKKNKKDFFGWLILNETLFDVSPNGYFDLIEHGHIIQGPSAVTDSPVVSTVFTQGQDPEGGFSEFGIGTTLPDIDSEN